MEQPRQLDLNNHFCNKCGKVATYIYGGKYLCTVDTQIALTQDKLKAEQDAAHAKSEPAAEQVKPLETKAPVKPVLNTQKGVVPNANPNPAAKATVAGAVKAT